VFSTLSVVKDLRFLGLLGIKNDGFREEIVTELLQKSQGFGKEGEVQEFAIDERKEGFLAMQAE